MDLRTALKEIGLSQKQAQVYLACLQLGQDTVLKIAKYANLKRPNVYQLLEELERSGLVSKVIKKKTTYYRAESPQKLMDAMHIKHELTKEILPQLQALHNVDPDKPVIKIYDGVDSVRQVYNDIFTYLNAYPKEELIIFGALADAIENFQTEVLDYFYTLMRKSKNKVREIGNDDPETRRYYKKSSRFNPKHEIRVIKDKDGRFFDTDDFLYGNTLVIFSVTEEIFAIVIESKAITTTYRTLFNMAWANGNAIST